MDPEQAKTLLWTFFAGQATPLQKKLLADWLADRQHYEVYYKWLHEWEQAHPQLLPDTDLEWQKLRRQLNEPVSGTPVRVRPLSAAGRGNWRWMAASVLLLIGLGWWQRETILFQTYATGNGEIRQITLPDGSRVTLNANSTLQFPRILALQSAREARLRGEAEFSVIHTVDHRPFLVHTPDGLEVRVLGTEFLVYSRSRGSKVLLKEGKVTLRSLTHRHRPLTIRPGDLVTVDPAGSVRLKSNQPVADHDAWKEQRFVFNRTPLTDIARQIEERFGVAVAIPDTTLAAQQLSGNFPARSANEMLSMLGQVLPLHVHRQGETAVLTPTTRSY